MIALGTCIHRQLTWANMVAGKIYKETRFVHKYQQTLQTSRFKFLLHSKITKRRARKLWFV